MSVGPATDSFLQPPSMLCTPLTIRWNKIILFVDKYNKNQYDCVLKMVIHLLKRELMTEGFIYKLTFNPTMLVTRGCQSFQE
jgi:hypothetical protein